VQIIGIVNVTEDSFSDGGRYLDPARAISHARRLRNDGADIVEVGAASSHPDARPVSTDEERRRLAPVIDALTDDGADVSVDTTHPATQRFALSQRVRYLNDVRGFPDPSIYEELAASDSRLVVMHSVTKGENAKRVTTDPLTIWSGIESFFAARVDALIKAGVSPDRLILDPGLGYFLGANPEPSVEVLGDIPRLRARFGLPVLVSPSRKSFLRTLTGRNIAEIGPATLAAELHAVGLGVDYLRTHDVASLADAVKVRDRLAEHGYAGAVELVQSWYAAMHAGDFVRAAAKLDPQVEWIEAEHSPYGSPGRALVGFDAVAREVWQPLARDWIDLQFAPESFLTTTDGVAVIGRYRGTHRSSRDPLDAQALHLWTVVDGRITRYRGFADTFALQHTTPHDEPPRSEGNQRRNPLGDMA
jgi:dihydropteroate synthase type 2